MDEELRKEDGGVLLSDEVKRRLQKRLRRRNALIVLTCLLIGAVILSIVAFFVVKRVFTITEIVCEDQVYYSAEQILEAAGAKTGVGIFFVDEEQMRANALQELPLLMDLQIQKEYPDKLIITAVPEEPQYYFVADIPQNEYVVVAKSRKVLFMLDEEQQVKEMFSSIFFVKMPSLLYTVTGQELGFEQRGDREYIPSFLEQIKSSAFAQQVVLVDLTNRFELTVYCQTQEGYAYRIYFGNVKNIEEKIAFAQAIKQRLPTDFQGLIGVENPAKGYADPDDK